MKKAMALSFLFGLGNLLAACEKGAELNEAWDQRNDPVLLLPENYKRRFSELPTTGSLAIVPWSDTYWPSYLGGIAYRWNAQNPQPFTYSFLTKEQIKTLSNEQFQILSPAEKYDIYMDRFDYPLATSELRVRTNASMAKWQGLCHGWAPASLLFKEPVAVEAINQSGIKVPFGASDVKALLTFIQGQSQTRTRFLGNRCTATTSNPAEISANPSCKGINSGAFHLILANQISGTSQGFNVDVSRGPEVWNQGVYAYTSNILSYRAPTAYAAPGTVKEAVVETYMKYGKESNPNWTALSPVSSNVPGMARYVYTVELDNNENIIGGTWLTQDRPEFAWIQEKAQFTGYFSKVNEIYKSIN